MRKLKVIIEVTGGVATVTEKPKGIAVLIINHDNPSRQGYNIQEEIDQCAVIKD